MRALIKKLAESQGYIISRAGSANDLALSANDEAFNAAWKEAAPYSLLGADRLFMLFQWARYSRMLPGDAAQVGVYRGGSAKLISRALLGSNKHLYLFDTFEGMPEVDASIDLHKKNDFSDTSLEGVQKLFPKDALVSLHKGVFPGTTGPIEDKQFSFVYIDTDIYTSTRDSLAFFYPRLVPGACMAFDDYQGKHTPGVKKALDEFLADKPEKPIITAMAQCIFVKQLR